MFTEAHLALGPGDGGRDERLCVSPQSRIVLLFDGVTNRRRGGSADPDPGGRESGRRSTAQSRLPAVPGHRLVAGFLRMSPDVAIVDGMREREGLPEGRADDKAAFDPFGTAAEPASASEPTVTYQRWATSITTRDPKDSGRAKPPPPDAGTSDAVLWPFADKVPPPRSPCSRPRRSQRLCPRWSGPSRRTVGSRLQRPPHPQPDGSFEALLPPRVNAFTFFWTEPPRSPGHPGHWERQAQGGRVFTIAGTT